MIIFKDKIYKIETRKGYTLLFAVILSSFILTVAVSILGIARKEVILSSSSRDSGLALMAAQNALECAIYQNNLYNMFDPATDYSNNNFTCGGDSSGAPQYISRSSSAYPEVMTSSPNISDNIGDIYKYTFYINWVSSGTCSDVRVYKYNKSFGSYQSQVTLFESRGYNTGWNTSVTPNDCSKSSPKKEERAISFIYE